MLGLPNLGNTCYINSFIQSVRYLRPFVYSLRDVTYKNDFSVIPSFIELLFANCDMQWLNTFVLNLSRTNPEFKVLRQCDAHELFLFVIDKLYDEVKTLENIFEGQFESTVTCANCNEPSRTTSSFISVSLDLEPAGEQKISTLLDKFSAEEVLNTPFECNQCGKTKNAIKKMRIEKYPTIIVFHLKRFKGDLRKNFCDLKLERELNLNSHKYTLTSCINHFGNIGFGHYTATCLKHDKSYIMCNDKTVQSLTMPEMSNLPYVLLYQKYK